MASFFTSDTHFNHKRIIQYCSDTRPFSCMEEMNETMIDIWNKKVNSNDIVYHLGDIGFGDINEINTIFDRLNGKDFRLVVGNHDTKFLKNVDFCKKFSDIRIYNEEKLFGENIVMMHYPIASWHRKNYGAIMLHGHCHGNPTNVSGRIKDVGWDTFQNLYDIEEIIEEMKIIPFL